MGSDCTYAEQVGKDAHIPDGLIPPYINRAWIYAERGDFQPALEDCEKALRINDVYSTAYAYRARVYCLQGHPEQALADCARALELDTHCADAWAVRGLIFFYQGNYNQALEDFKQALSMGKNLFWIDGKYASVCSMLKGADEGAKLSHLRN